MSEREKDFMREAIAIAKENVKNGNGGPFGAVIVLNDKIVGKGVNTVTKTNDPTAHAEINAIKDACKKIENFQLNDCEIYSSCEPCPMCLGAIYWARPNKLFYACSKEDAANVGFDDSFIYKEVMLPIAKRKIKTEQILREESTSIFKDWEATINKIEY